jgi:hypothetical protein
VASRVNATVSNCGLYGFLLEGRTARGGEKVMFEYEIGRVRVTASMSPLYFLHP